METSRSISWMTHTMTTNTARTPLENATRTPLETTIHTLLKITTPMDISDTAIKNNDDNISPLTIDYESDTKLEIIAMEQLERDKEMPMVEDEILMHEEPEGNDYEALDEEVISSLSGLTMIDA
jgi:hypothetical protein